MPPTSAIEDEARAHLSKLLEWRVCRRLGRPRRRPMTDMMPSPHARHGWESVDWHVCSKGMCPARRVYAARYARRYAQPLVADYSSWNLMDRSMPECRLLYDC